MQGKSLANVGWAGSWLCQTSSPPASHRCSEQLHCNSPATTGPCLEDDSCTRFEMSSKRRSRSVAFVMECFLVLQKGGNISAPIAAFSNTKTATIRSIGLCATTIWARNLVMSPWALLGTSWEVSARASVTMDGVQERRGRGTLAWLGRARGPNFGFPVWNFCKDVDERGSEALHLTTPPHASEWLHVLPRNELAATGLQQCLPRPIADSKSASCLLRAALHFNSSACQHS